MDQAQTSTFGKSASFINMLTANPPYVAPSGCHPWGPVWYWQWGALILWPSHHVGPQKQPVQSPELLPEVGGPFLAETPLLAEDLGFQLGRRGAVWATGAVRGSSLALCPCCCHLLAKGRRSCCLFPLGSSSSSGSLTRVAAASLVSVRPAGAGDVLCRSPTASSAASVATPLGHLDTSLGPI